MDVDFFSTSDLFWKDMESIGYHIRITQSAIWDLSIAIQHTQYTLLFCEEHTKHHIAFMCENYLLCDIFVFK